MGMQIDRRPIDARLLEDEEFFDFFLDEMEELFSGDGDPVELDGENKSGDLMRNTEYIDKVYEKYKGEKGT